MTPSEKIEEIVKGIEEETNFEVLKEMKSILNKVFGEENNQILKPEMFSIKKMAEEEGVLDAFMEMCNNEDVNKIRSYIKTWISYAMLYQIIIKFPKIEITNGKNKHTIEDLYVRCFVRSNGTLVPELYGIRAKLTIPELKSGYSHSHLPPSNPFYPMFELFCTGIGPINKVMMVLSTKFTDVNFKMFLFQLKVFVSWESKEGRPHMYLEDIGKANNDSYYFLYNDYAERAADKLIRSMRGLSIEKALSYLYYDVTPTKIIITPNPEYEKWAYEVIKNWDVPNLFTSNLTVNNLLNTKDTAGNYYNIPKDECNEDLYKKDAILLMFKGEPIKLHVEFPKELQNKKHEEKVPHPLITGYVSEKLSKLLTKEAFSNARIRVGSAGSDKSETSGSNPFSM